MTRFTQWAILLLATLAMSFGNNLLADDEGEREKSKPSKALAQKGRDQDRVSNSADPNSADQSSAAKHDGPTEGEREQSLRRKESWGFTPEREAAAITFVKQHHPELAPLLAHLKGSNEREYKAAIRDLFRISERLVRTRQFDQERYQRDLAAWKLRSRLQLLLAQLQMKRGDKRLEQELEQVLRRQLELQRERLEYEKKHVAARLEKIQTHLDRLSGHQEQIIQKQLEQLLSRGGQRSQASGKELRESTRIRAKASQDRRSEITSEPRAGQNQ